MASKPKKSSANHNLLSKADIAEMLNISSQLLANKTSRAAEKGEYFPQPTYSNKSGTVTLYTLEDAKEVYEFITRAERERLEKAKAAFESFGLTTTDGEPVEEPTLDLGTEKVADKVADKPAEKAAEKAADKPAEKVAEKPVEKSAPADKAADNWTGKPTEKVAAKDADKVADKPTVAKAPEVKFTDAKAAAPAAKADAARTAPKVTAPVAPPATAPKAAAAKAGTGAAFGLQNTNK